MTSLTDVRTLFSKILHLRESVHRTALAFAIGVVIAFSPTYGLHTATVVFCAWAFGLNFVALMAGAFINNPWTVIPILGATFWAGARLTGMSELPSLDWSDLSFMGIYDQVLPYAWPFFLGGFVLSTFGGLLAYPLAYYVIARYRQGHARDPQGPLPPLAE